MPRASRPAPLPLRCSVRDRRAAAGLSQDALARRVGVSRQALISIEAGRQVPSTALSLQLARALGCRVEDLFALPAPSGPDAHPAPGALLAPRLTVGRVAGRWVAHPARAEDLPADALPAGLPRPDGLLPLEPLVPLRALEQQVLVAGCAPLLGLLAARASRPGGERASWIPADSGAALSLFEDGLVHVAGLHLVDGAAREGHAPLVRARFPGRAFTLVHLTRWTQGLVLPPGNPAGIRGVTDLLRPGLRFARRAEGSGAHRLLARLLAPHGSSLPDGPLASGHAEVARLVRWGAADLGLAIQAVAAAEGLDFLPLAEERFDLLLSSDGLADPRLGRLLDGLEARAFRAEAARLPGYDLREAGHATSVAA